MRGKERYHFAICEVYGITPAYAGKSAVLKQLQHSHMDHPRVCGEKVIRHPFPIHKRGSPPRMRGKADPAGRRVVSFGITPAYAGKSGHFAASLCPFEDHPRVCGEKSRETRGGGTLWITPAYAGKRLKRSRSTVSHVAIVPLFPSVCNKPVVSDGSPAGRDAPLFLPAENAVPASPAYNLRSL